MMTLAARPGPDSMSSLDPNPPRGRMLEFNSPTQLTTGLVERRGCYSFAAGRSKPLSTISFS